MSKNWTLEKTGIRFFTQYDMCARCRDMVCNFANKEAGKPFIVLSREQYIEEKECPCSIKCKNSAEDNYLNSRKRNNPKEKTLFKFELK